MVFYELLCIVRKQGGSQEVKDIARTLGMTVIQRGGVVRKYVNWGVLQLPKQIRRHQQRHDWGQYFLMFFDSSPWTQMEIDRTLNLDPRIVRHTVIKIGDRPDTILHIPGVTTSNGVPVIKNNNIEAFPSYQKISN
ncbi:37S ribosomal protein MRP17, mitochondrial [Neolecta irregularis DAH-3]|uniref:37S ribosomal protein MRP17, mitochondrial n=1 Tax=Neolecta irregularis (strain DAH-3) TaxID=1198029 RepID=A0A1U7LV05_NEOID|nr:37S ribosomal protein MRP17, mitochondrial [Neolecta irregularis DAH-3]|eukprot:OLL26506.1 37S ribosomal protein MRP17, mitochondrial [Neolecta irregularis DAH-3]